MKNQILEVLTYVLGSIVILIGAILAMFLPGVLLWKLLTGKTPLILRYTGKYKIIEIITKILPGCLSLIIILLTPEFSK